MDPDLEEHPPEAQGKPAAGGRNPLLIFLGFALLGAALALLFFGRDLFNFGANKPAAIVGEASVTTQESSVLDQVSELAVDELGSAGEADDGFLEVGDTAYDFTVNDLDGNPVSLTDFRGQPTVVNFWATWCAPCRIEMPVFQDAFERHQDDGLVILALNQAEQAAVAGDYFYDEMGLTFTPLLDEKSEVATRYGSYSVLPSTYFIDPEGTVVAIHRGPLTEGQLAGYLAAAGVENG
jgi:peroxiredoxin